MINILNSYSRLSSLGEYLQCRSLLCLSVSLLRGISGIISNVQKCVKNIYRQPLCLCAGYNCGMQKIFENMELWRRMCCTWVLVGVGWQSVFCFTAF